MSQRSLLPSLLLVVFLGPASHAQPPSWPFEQPFMPHRGRLGVQIQPMTAELREYFKAPSDRGLLVTRVDPDGPAARAGLHVGDVILTAGGAPLERPFDLVKAVGRVPAGQTLELRVIREGHERTFNVEPQGAATPWVDPDYWGEWMEKGLQQGTESLRRRLDDLQRRLEELERKLDPHPQPDEKQRT